MFLSKRGRGPGSGPGKPGGPGSEWRIKARLLEDMASRHVELSGVSFSMCISASRWKNARHLLQEMPQALLQQNIITAGACLSCCERASQWRPVLAMLLALQEEEVQPSTIAYNTALSACKCCWQRAIDLARVGGVRLDTISYNSLMHAARWQRALSLQGCLREKGLQESTTSCNTILACTGNWESAVLTFAAAASSGLELDTISRNSVMNACKVSSWALAVYLAELPLADTFTCATAAAAMGRTTPTPSWRSALALCGKLSMRRVPESTVAFNALISVCDLCGQWPMALALLNLCRAKSLADTVTYSQAISACEEEAAWQAALQVLQHQEAEVKTDVITYNASISACGRGSQWQRALSLLKTLRKKLQPTVISWNAGISACEPSGQWQVALLLLDEHQQERVESDIVTYSTVISCCEKARQWQAACHVLQLLLGSSISPSSVPFSAAISACEKTLQWQLALVLLHQWRPSLVACNAAISACEKCQRWRQALALLADMETRPCSRTS
ncbi:unnamed protein product [Effrenium voratum]|uniref:Pentatricopeptide repeat-containing protein, chloroplastic n=1 Tax=Effrenium voratum TaxID=2562239 RepID=A0AA36NEJ9_9DINO|nr:unnamed protein product [Effrenium voratum]